jgi:hypothetical protein
VLNLEEGDAMNMRIFTGSCFQSVIPDVQCGSMFPLLIFEGSSMELVIGEDAS